MTTKKAKGIMQLESAIKQPKVTLCELDIYLWLFKDLTVSPILF